MSRTTSTFTAGAFLLLALGACTNPPPYEDDFQDIIHISYVSAPSFEANIAAYDQAMAHKETIDAMMREKQIGYYSGIMGSGNGVDFIDLAVDFDSIDEKAFVQSLIDQGLIPAEARVSYQPHKYNY